MNWLGSYFRDLRHGGKLLYRDPWNSALIVLVLALGIGGNAVVFTLLKAAFLDRLPFHDASRLVVVTKTTGWFPAVSEWLEIRARSRTLEQLALAEYRDLQVAGAGDPVRVYTARVTASFFPLLRAKAALGRTLLPDDNQPGRAPVVVLTDAFWRSQMGADPAAVGRTLRLDGQPALIVGVLSTDFHFDYPTLRILEPVDIYVPFPLVPSIPWQVGENGFGIPVLTIARLRDGVAFAQAESEIRSIGSALFREHPSGPRGGPEVTYLISKLRDAVVGTQRSLLWLLLGGAGVLLLIACANTAQLLLARSLRRGREVAIRAALGASRWRLIRQFLLEGMVLAACGGTAGLLLSGWVARLLVAVLPVRSPLLESAHLDARVVAFIVAVSLISALIFAIVPAVKGSRWMPGPGLNARTAAGEGNRWRHVMIAVEAALSIFLLCGAGLVTQNLWALLTTPVGFDPHQVMVMRLKLPARPPNTMDNEAGRILQDYVDRITAIPGVESAATTSAPPLRPVRAGLTELVGVTEPSGQLKSVIAWNHQVSKDYFRALRIPLLAGRGIEDSDSAQRVSVAVVTQEFARRFGLGAGVIGKQIDRGPGQRPVNIVGIVGDVRTRSLETTTHPEIYLSSLQFSWANVYLVIRASLPPTQLVKDVKAAIQSANSDQAVYGAMTMEEMIAASQSQPRFNAYLVGAFAILALSMAVAGMYSVIACLVSQRTGEIAIRMVLGASRGDIVRAILGATGLWAVAGLTLGLAAGFATRNLLRTLSDTAVQGALWMYFAVALFFVLVMLLAVYQPVRRASHLDPAVALRCE